AARVEAFDHLVVAVAIEDDDALAGDHWTAIAITDLFGPDAGGPILRPGLEEAGVGGDAVALRPEDLRPIRGAGRGDDAVQRHHPKENPQRCASPNGATANSQGREPLGHNGTTRQAPTGRQ